MWPKLFKPETTFEDRWVTDLLLDTEGLKNAKAKGLRIKKRDDYGTQFDGYDGSYLNLTRNVANKTKGGDNTPPVVLDAKLSKISQEIDIGNGTDARVRAMVKTRNMSGQEMSPAEAMKEYKGYGLFLTDVMIINLIPYERSDDPENDFVPVEGGFEAAAGTDAGIVDDSMDWAKPTGGDDSPFDEQKVAG